MEIDITDFARNCDPADYSASRAELGDNAGKITWEAAKDADLLLTTPEAFDALQAWAKSTGAWDEAERAAWTEKECNALFVQLVSGDLREAIALAPGSNDEGIDWLEYERLCEEGTCGGCLFASSDRIYYSLEG